MARAAADLTIVDVSPDESTIGDFVNPVVTVFNENTSAAPGEEFDTGWVIVENPQFNLPIVWYCAIIEPQATMDFPGFSSCPPSMDCLGGFDMSSQIDLNVDAGGSPDGVHCSNARSLGQTTDSIVHTVTVPPSSATFSVFNTGGDGASESGPFQPGSNPVIAEYKVINSGGGVGDINVVFSELDSNGNVVAEICSDTFSNVSPEETVGIGYNREMGIICNSFTGGVNALLQPSLSSQFGVTQHFGIKTWSEDESEPDFPSSVISTRTVEQ